MADLRILSGARSEERTDDRRGVLYRFIIGFVFRGFFDIEQCASFVQVKPEIVIEWLQKRRPAEELAEKFGINMQFLWKGEGPLTVDLHSSWYDAWRPSLHAFSNGPTEYPYAAATEEEIGQRAREAEKKTKDHFRSLSRMLEATSSLTKEEQAAIDAVWDPDEIGRWLLFLQSVLDKDLLYEEYANTKLKEVARLGFYMFEDREKGFLTREDIKNVRGDLAEHSDKDVPRLSAHPYIHPALVDHYLDLIEVCHRLADRFERELLCAAGQPLRPYPDMIQRRKLPPSPAA